MTDLISREEVLKHQFTFVDESGIGLSYYDVVSVSNIQKIHTVPAISLEKVKQVRNEIEALKPNNINFRHYVGETRAINNVLEILDKLIEESEDNK